MNPHVSPEDAGFDPKDWHAELSARRFGYVANLRHQLGFIVSFRAHDDSDEIFGEHYWIAELIHRPASGEMPDAALLPRLHREAVKAFLRKLHEVRRRLAAMRALSANTQLEEDAA